MNCPVDTRRAIARSMRGKSTGAADVTEAARQAHTPAKHLNRCFCIAPPKWPSPLGYIPAAAGSITMSYRLARAYESQVTQTRELMTTGIPGSTVPPVKTSAYTPMSKCP